MGTLYDCRRPSWFSGENDVLWLISSIFQVTRHSFTPHPPPPPQKNLEMEIIKHTCTKYRAAFCSKSVLPDSVAPSGWYEMWCPRTLQKEPSMNRISCGKDLIWRFLLTGKGHSPFICPQKSVPPLCYSSYITPCWIYRFLHLPGGCHWSRFTFSVLHIPQSCSSVPLWDSPESHCITPCPPLYSPVRVFFLCCHCSLWVSPAFHTA